MAKIQHCIGKPVLTAKDISLIFGGKEKKTKDGKIEIVGGKQILKDINIDICDITRPDKIQGQVIGFLGPSGIGKTKFSEILAGVLAPTTGEVMIGDPLIPVEIGMVGMVQQRYPLFMHHTVYDNLHIALTKTKLTPAEKKDKIWSILERFNLTDHVKKYPSQLSGGQKQRVAIAQQLLCSEHFLILDEPFSGLDIAMVDKVCQMITDIANAHEINTVILISHDVYSTVAVADHLWLMGRDRDAKGEIIPGAKIKQVYNLIEMDLAWHKDVASMPAFVELFKEIKGVFPSL